MLFKCVTVILCGGVSLPVLSDLCSSDGKFGSFTDSDLETRSAK